MIRLSAPPRASHRALSLAIAAALLNGAPAPAATYYVDFAGGSDKASGLSPETAWKRAPGDSRAGPAPRATRLQPGDTILFRGGVSYRGTIVIRAAGTAQAPIRYVGDSWGPTPALLDGSEPTADARPCRSARDCAGDPGWARLYRVSLGSDGSASDGLFQQDQPLAIVPAGMALTAGTASPMPASAGRVLLVHPLAGRPSEFVRGAGRVGFLLVAGGHVQIRGFQPVRFTPAPRFGPYAGLPLVQLQHVEGVTLTAFPSGTAFRKAPPVGPAIAGVTSGPV